MEKKKQIEAPTEDEITQIEHDFKNIFGEMTDISSIREFADIFRQIHSLLMDSHSKNQKLAELVQKLNGQIVSNATKVQSLLKMSEDDHKSIDLYKEEYEKAWKIVSASQSKELEARDTCESLRNKVTELTKEVQNQTSNENAYNELQSDIDNFEEESARRLHEIEVITSDLNAATVSLRQQEHALEQAKGEIQQINITSNIEDQHLLRMMDSCKSVKQDIEKTLTDNKELNAQIDENVNTIRARKKAVNDARQEMIRYKSLRKDYEIEGEGIQRAISGLISKRDRIVGVSDKTQKKIKHMSVMVDTTEREAQTLRKKIQRYDEILNEHQAEHDDLEQCHNTMITEIKATQRDRNVKMQGMIELIRNNGAAESLIHQATRSNDTAVRSVAMRQAELVEAKTEKTQARVMTQIVTAHMTATKGGIIEDDLKAATVEKEMNVYRQKAHETKVQLVRLADTMSIIASDSERAAEDLENLTRSSKEHDKIISEMQNERDTISNAIQVVERNNAKLAADLKSKRELVNKMKQDIQDRTRECIEIHFQTRSIEKQIQALDGVIEMTQNLYNEAQQTIVGYKAEGTKLRLIYEEAQKDITLAKAEGRNLLDITRMLERQLCIKREEVDKATVDMNTMRYILDHHSSAFEKQTDDIDDLTEQLERTVWQNRMLSQRAAASRAMELEIMALESRVDHERGLRNRYEEEMMKPMNVHRWTIMKMMAPDTWKSIEMIQYLKAKIEDAHREKLKLEDSKKKILKIMESNEIRMKNIHIQDGNYALQVFKDALAKKDRELKEMEAALNERKGIVTEMAETVKELNRRVKSSKIATTSIKRQERALERPEIPMLAIGPKMLERTRLGGGFDISARKDNLSSRKPPSARSESASRATTARTVKVTRKVEEDLLEDGHFSARDVSRAGQRAKKAKSSLHAATARTESAQSWKPRKTKKATTEIAPELSITPAASDRPKSEVVRVKTESKPDPIRQKSAQTARRTPTSIDDAYERFNRRPNSRIREQSTPSSARSARSTTSQGSARPAVKVHTTLIEF